MGNDLIFDRFDIHHHNRTSLVCRFNNPSLRQAFYCKLDCFSIVKLLEILSDNRKNIPIDFLINISKEGKVAGGAIRLLLHRLKSDKYKVPALYAIDTGGHEVDNTLQILKNLYYLVSR